MSVSRQRKLRWRRESSGKGLRLLSINLIIITYITSCFLGMGGYLDILLYSAGRGGEFSLFLPIFFKVFSLLQFWTYKVGKIKKRGILCNDNVLVAIMRKTLLHRQPMLRGKGCEGQCSDVRVTADVIFLECNRAWQQGCKIIIKHFMVKGYSEVCAFL